jgi:hypothetical protein
MGQKSTTRGDKPHTESLNENVRGRPVSDKIPTDKAIMSQMTLLRSKSLQNMWYFGILNRDQMAFILWEN